MGTTKIVDGIERYWGWAPCCHADAETRKAHRESVFPEKLRELCGLDAERLQGMLFLEIGCISWSHVEVNIDQWYGLYTNGEIGPHKDPTNLKFATWIECDALDEGLMETYKIWAERHKAHTGQAYVPGWEED